jgi:hypothetical protein
LSQFIVSFDIAILLRMLVAPPFGAVGTVKHFAVGTRKRFPGLSQEDL